MTDLIIKPEGSEDPGEYILRLNQSGTAEVTGLIGGQAYRAGVIAWDDAPFVPLESAMPAPDWAFDPGLGYVTFQSAGTQQISNIQAVPGLGHLAITYDEAAA